MLPRSTGNPGDVIQGSTAPRKGQRRRALSDGRADGHDIEVLIEGTWARNAGEAGNHGRHSGATYGTEDIRLRRADWNCGEK